MSSAFLGRGWSFPFRFDPKTGGPAMSSGEQSIRESITLILGTRPGERQMLPEFGCRIHEVVFTPNTRANASLVAHHVRTALERWEPRIELVDVSAEPADTGRMAVRVAYRVRATRGEHVLALDLHTGG